MAKFKIAFYLNMYLAGGVEKSLIGYLNALNHDMFDIDLIIANYMGAYELPKVNIPKYINIIYLNNFIMLNQIMIKRVTSKLNIVDKIFESMLLKPIRQIIFGYKIKVLARYDCVIDYAIELRKNNSKFIKNLNMIGFFHFDINHYFNNIKSSQTFYKQIYKYKKIICITRDMLVDAKNKFNLISNKFDLLYNQFDFDDIYNKSDLVNKDYQLDLIRYPILKNKKYILSIARLENIQKDFPTLLKAYAICVYQYSIDMPLVIIGDGLFKADLVKYTKDLNIAHMVYFLGFKYNPYPYFNNARMFILSSRYEGFGLVLVEAMIMHVPVISTDCKVGPRELLLDGECGLLCSVGDYIDMADKIMRLYNDDRISQELVRNADKNLYGFEMKHNIKTLEDLILNIC